MNRIYAAGRLVAPSKVVCIGRNYAAHAEELGNEVPEELVVFLKPNSAVRGTFDREGHGQAFPASIDGEALHYEGEICLLVEGGRFVAAGFGIDLTRRELQGRLKAKGLPWERAKAFDGAALLGPFERLPPAFDVLGVALDIDGASVQRGDSSMMLFPPATLLRELGTFLTLTDGDVIMTGTPAGVGPVPPGARFEGCVLVDGEVLTTASWTASD